MKSCSLGAVVGVVVAAGILSGCSWRAVTEPHGRVVAQPRDVNTDAAPVVAPVGQQPSPPGAQGTAPVLDVDLTSRLLSLPAAKAQPQFRWPQQLKGTRVHPLPTGLLLSWTESITADNKDRLFSVSALNAEGKPSWTYRLARPVDGVKFAGVSPSGQRVAFMESDGNVHVLSTADGQVVATVHVDIGADVDTVELIADGQFIAVERSTRSGVVPRTLAVYPVASDSKRLYGTSGMAVTPSPYHDMVLGLEALDRRGVAATAAMGPVGFIPYEYQVQAEWVTLASSADGQLIYVASRDKGLDVYGRDLKRRLHLDASPDLDREFAPVSKVIWHDVSPGVIQVIDAQGKMTSFVIDRTKIGMESVMPGGEKVFQVESHGQKLDCVVKTNGDVFGCFPFVGFDATTIAGRPMFWARLEDGSTAAYTP